jgi:MtaA/CmuA family methyltransferase
MCGIWRRSSVFSAGGHMESIERMKRRLKGEQVDRPPNFDLFMTFAARHIGQPLSKYYLNHRVLVDANFAMVDDFGVDLVQAISDPYREASDFGAEIEFPPDDLPVCRKPLLEDFKDLRKIRKPDPRVSPRMLDRIEAIRMMREKAGMGTPVMGWVEGALAEAADLRGVSATLLDAIDRPEWLQELLEVCVEVEIEFAQAQVEAGADLIGLGDAVASQISPAMYRKFALPYERRIFDAVHAKGALTRLHICGNTTMILSDLMSTGADIIDLDWMVDWRAASEKFGARVSLCGNVDPVSVMLQADSDTVYEHVLDCLRVGGERSFSGAGCEIPDKTPAENLQAQIRAIREWGGGRK